MVLSICLAPSTMLPAAPPRDRKSSSTRLDVFPKLLADQSSLSQSGAEGSVAKVNSRPLSPPAHVHIHETSPHISGYLDFVSPLSCSPTTPEMTSTAVSRKTSTNDIIAASASSSSGVTGHLERFPRRICSAFFVYFVSCLSSYLCRPSSANYN